MDSANVHDENQAKIKYKNQNFIFKINIVCSTKRYGPKDNIHRWVCMLHLKAFNLNSILAKEISKSIN